MFNAGTNPSRRLRLPALYAVMLAGAGLTWGQGSGSAVQPSGSDPFVEYHNALTATADKVLAAQTRVNERPTSKSLPPSTDLEPTTLKPRGVSGATARVQQLRPVIEPILLQERVPGELTAVVLVESGGQPNALSRKGARGLWQFMPDTARRYGLAVTPEYDERLDVSKSTRAAARYLRDLYFQFGDWHLAFAAYNAGGNTVQRAIERQGTRDFAQLTGLLPVETRKYVPSVINAMHIMGKAAGRDPVANAGMTWVLYAGAQAGQGATDGENR